MIKTVKCAALVLIAVLTVTVSACKKNEPERDIQSAVSYEDTEEYKTAVCGYMLSESVFGADDENESFVGWLADEFGSDVLKRLADDVKNGTFSDKSWHKNTGNSLIVLKSMYRGELDPNSENYRTDIKPIKSDGNTVIRAVGDFSLADNWDIAPVIEKHGGDLESVLSKDIIDCFRSADIMLLNNEFTFSKRGKPLDRKAYTFRADPKWVSVYDELGVDIVSLANNHAYDYGADAFADTLETLFDAGVPYIGGGKDIDEASKPFYFIVNGYKYAFTAATRAEKYKLTPEATKTSSGVLRTYDPEKYIGVISSAAKESDYVIAYVHWGKEGSHDIEEGLPEMGAAFIDAGADIVIGSHAHVLQGIDFYNGKPIVYNLGNFLFNAKTMDTGILELTADDELKMTYRFIPCIQSGCHTKNVSGDEAKRVLSFMGSLSENVVFEEDGTFFEKQNG